MMQYLPQNPLSSFEPLTPHSLSPHYHKNSLCICHFDNNTKSKGQKRDYICGVTSDLLDKPNIWPLMTVKLHNINGSENLPSVFLHIMARGVTFVFFVAKPQELGSDPSENHIFESKLRFLNQSSSCIIKSHWEESVDDIWHKNCERQR